MEKNTNMFNTHPRNKKKIRKLRIEGKALILIKYAYQNPIANTIHKGEIFNQSLP